MVLACAVCPLAQEGALDYCTTCTHSAMLSEGYDDLLWYRHMQSTLQQQGATVDTCQSGSDVNRMPL